MSYIYGAAAEKVYLFKEENIFGGRKMLNGVIIRGTNPEHEFELPYSSKLIKNIRVIYGQNGKSILKKIWNRDTNDNTCQLQEGKIIVPLSQEDTYLISPGTPLEIEIRVQLTDDKVVRSEDSIKLRVIDTMDNEVMN